VARVTRALLHGRAGDRKARVVVIQMRNFGLQRGQIPQLAVGTGESHGVVSTRGGVARSRAVKQGDVMALAEHHIVIQVVAQVFPQLERVLVELAVTRHHVVGAHNGRVAPGVATTEPALFEHRDIAQAVIFGEIVGRGQAVKASADDNNIIGFLRFGITPLAGPALVSTQASSVRDHAIGGSSPGVHSSRF